MTTTWRYRPANTVADLAPEVAATGRKSMQEFLLSPQMAKPVFKATMDIRDAAQVLAVAEAFDTGDFSSSFIVEPVAPIVIAGNPRVAFRVVNNDRAAAPNEFGNSRTEAKRILGRAGEPWHSTKEPL